jgi:hypothetical protein
MAYFTGAFTVTLSCLSRRWVRVRLGNVGQVAGINVVVGGVIPPLGHYAGEASLRSVQRVDEPVVLFLG